MSWLCEHGIHSYRHVELSKNRLIGVAFEPTTWDHTRRCKRCLHERTILVFRYPRIRSYDWGDE